jgi:hypothetical protein
MDADNPIERTSQMLAARQAVAEAWKVPTLPRLYYKQTARQLPALLQQHGLGQTLAYLQLRGEGRPASPYTVLLRQLDRWLLATLEVSARSALAALAARDSQFYIEATRRAWLFVSALRAVLDEPRATGPGEGPATSPQRTMDQGPMR